MRLTRRLATQPHRGPAMGWGMTLATLRCWPQSCCAGQAPGMHHAQISKRAPDAAGGGAALAGAARARPAAVCVGAECASPADAPGASAAPRTTRAARRCTASTASATAGACAAARRASATAASARTSTLPSATACRARRGAASVRLSAQSGAACAARRLAAPPARSRQRGTHVTLKSAGGRLRPPHTPAQRSLPGSFRRRTRCLLGAFTPDIRCTRVCQARRRPRCARACRTGNSWRASSRSSAQRAPASAPSGPPPGPSSTWQQTQLSQNGQACRSPSADRGEALRVQAPGKAHSASKARLHMS